jgi:hypothetical protein
MLMPFGKYRGRSIESIGTSYLHWLYDEVDMRPRLRRAVVTELRARGVHCDDDDDCDYEDDRDERESYSSHRHGGASLSISPEDAPLAIEIVRQGFRSLAKRFHPDTGGSDEQMKHLNRVHAALAAQLGDAK